MTTISGGTVHRPTKAIRERLERENKAREQWQDITPLARNEFICWITSAKKSETQDHRLDVAIDKLNRGERRPCCWAGCPHREKNGT